MTTQEKILELVRAAGAAVRPPERYTVSEWADKFRRLSPEASVEKPWETWPFQREPMDAAGSDDPCDHVVVMAASQVLKTELILNAIGRAICCDPGPIAVFETKEPDAEALSKDRITPMIRDSAVLREKVSEAKSRDSGNTIAQKGFPGGTLYILGAGSASNLAMRPIRYLFRDECDRWIKNVDNEGSPFALSERRTSRFWNRKIVDTSSPTDENGFIYQQFQLSDRRFWQVPCPGCHAMQKFVWENVKWGEMPDGQAWQIIGGGIAQRIALENAHYLCAYCDKLIPHAAKAQMNDAGRYVAENPASSIKGFHCNALCYPIRSWGHYAQESIEKKANPLEWRSFVNTVCAEVYSEPGERPNWEVLRARTQPYRLCDEPGTTVPAGALFLTCGIDVQRGRGGGAWCEAHVWGWGTGKRSWLIDHQRFEGKITDQETQAKLESFLWETRYMHASGAEMQIERAAIDSGEEAMAVYDWSRRQPRGRLLVVKGSDTGDRLLGIPKRVDITRSGKTLKKGASLYVVNVSMAKRELYAWLLSESGEDGAKPLGHVSLPENISNDWLKQFTSEEWRELTNRSGHRQGRWHQTQERNEALDCRNYARAAAADVGIDRFSARDWKAWESLYSTEPDPVLTKEPQIEAVSASPPAPLKPEPVSDGLVSLYERRMAEVAERNPPPKRGRARFRFRS